MTIPTDAEIQALADEMGIGWAAGLGGMAEFLRLYTDAVLAKWGHPQAVAGGEPVATQPTPDVAAKMLSNTWDHFGDILPTLKAISRGDWYWGANSRCKYIEIRLDTRDGGCILYDRERVRISPEQFAHQHHRVKMEPWPASNSPDTAPPPQAVREPLTDEVRWCGNCGEGVTFFCRSKTVGECPMKLGRVVASGITKGGQHGAET